MTVQQECKAKLCTHSVCTGYQYRILHAGKAGPEKAAESADVANDLGTIGRLHARANRIDGTRTFVDVDARVLIRDLLCHGRSSSENETFAQGNCLICYWCQKKMRQLL